MSYQQRKFPPFIPMGILPPIFWRCDDLFGVWSDTDKKIAYSRNAKIVIAENLKIYCAYNSSISGFALPLPCDFGKGRPKLHSEQIWEKSVKGIWNYKEIKFC